MKWRKKAQHLTRIPSAPRTGLGCHIPFQSKRESAISHVSRIGDSLEWEGSFKIDYHILWYDFQPGDPRHDSRSGGQTKALLVVRFESLERAVKEMCSHNGRMDLWPDLEIVCEDIFLTEVDSGFITHRHISWAGLLKSIEPQIAAKEELAVFDKALQGRARRVAACK